MKNGIVVAVEISLLCPSEKCCYKNREQISRVIACYTAECNYILRVSPLIGHFIWIQCFKLVPLQWKNIPLGQLVRVEADREGLFGAGAHRFKIHYASVTINFPWVSVIKQL